MSADPTAGPLTEQQHEDLRSLLGAWALGACPRREAAGLERHLRLCPDCAEEGTRLRDAAGWLSADEPLDPSGALRQQVLDWCLARRPAELPVPAWGAPYGAETAKLDALLRDLGPEEWQEIVELPWHGGTDRLRPAEVLSHLAAVDGYLALALGLPDPVPAGPDPGAPVAAPGPAAAPAAPRIPAQAGQPATRVPRQGASPFSGIVDRSERLAAAQAGCSPESVRTRWRRQTHALVRSAALAPGGNVPVDYGFAALPLRDAFVDRAFECYVHGEDVARAVAYPYAPPAPPHLRQMIDLAARMLPEAVAALRRAGRPGPTGHPGHGPGPGPGGDRPARLLRLVIDGPAAGEWLIPLDGPAPPGNRAGYGRTTEPVAAMVLDGLEFCQLAAAHRDPDRLPVGEHGDRAAIREVLRAAPLLSRP
ncbi:zf-HC2 domain-containing protein [Kitasatospora sp. NBC_00240]|uniref:zf-HC2 domain-containing protein n=1 Tax=Kitasatospora sp. NBC_00240 TaxID=2903567 RepID=UPI002251C408|nr:zf-HC2 domain-containing protein [Kitasatospora sp. NBC_00240]MCX5211243.1 zf-HC2 domain-containing protein [Kitasatospora sp. NBC_00240]